MPDKPVVSVLFPCFNAAATVEAAVDSLRSQSLPDFEIVAVNDGSQDGTPEILEKWTQLDSRIRIIHQPHRGIITALNTGLEACRSDNIARMDADDLCHPQRLEKQLAYLQAHPSVAVTGCLVRGYPVEQVREGFRIYLDWLNSLVEDADIRREMFVESPLAHPSVMYRKEWVLRVGGYQDHGWPEDYDLWLRLYLTEARFGKVPEVLLEWGEYPQRLTRSDSRYSVENFIRAKANYLVQGPLKHRQGVIVWGAGMMGRRLSKQLLRLGCPVKAFVDVDPAKIGRTRRGLPIIARSDLRNWWQRLENPALLVAVRARGARDLIRKDLSGLGLQEGLDWWSTA